MSFQNQPLGTIIASILNYDQLCQVMGEQKGVANAKSSYAPCDGRLIDGSALEKLTSTEPDPTNHVRQAPDLRGRFLRGLNSVYSPGEPLPFNPLVNGDPDGNNRKAGTYQGDVLLAHNHPANGHINGSVNGTNGSHDADSGHDKWNSDPNYGDHNVIVNVANNPNGGAETRPRNVAVYYYIRIN